VWLSGNGRKHLPAAEKRRHVRKRYAYTHKDRSESGLWNNNRI